MSNSVNLFELIGVAIISYVKHSSALVNLRASWSYSCVQCTACDCAYIKT